MALITVQCQYAAFPVIATVVCCYKVVRSIGKDLLQFNCKLYFSIVTVFYIVDDLTVEIHIIPALHGCLLQVVITLIGFIIGFGIYGPVSLYGVMAIEAAPTHLSGTSHAIVSLACNSKQTHFVVCISCAQALCI